jgi:hypothetical protein
MKTWKKIFLCILALIVIAGIVCVTMFVTNKNRIKEYSTYCMDEVRSQLWEYLENVSNFYEWKNNENNWYLYSWKVSYEWADYDYYCRVSGKNNAEAFLTNLTEWNESENHEDFVSYYDNWVIREKWAYIDWKKEWIWTTYDEEWNVIEMKEYKNWELVEGDLETYNDTNILLVDENNILNTDELKKLCVENLKELSENPDVTRTDEKLFINTYWFKWIYKGELTDKNSPIFCTIHVNWQVFSNWFFLDQWQSMDEIHSEMSYGNPWWIWEKYPNIKEFYWFIWNIVLWDMIQTTYLTWKNIMYYDPYRWIAFKLWAEFDWGLIREIDTDENGIPHSEIILLVKWDENEDNRTWINGFREVYTITAISKENLENFGATPDFEDKIIWENNDYYFIGEKTDTESYSNLVIFDVEKQTY